MGKKLSYLTAVVCLAAASNVSAASSTDLSVKGTITPAACVPQLSNGGVVDHGKISINDFVGTGTPIKQLPAVSLQLSVSCDAATFFAVQSTENRKDTAADNSPSSFGLGLGEDDQKLGLYTLAMENALADGAQARLVESVDGDVWFPVSAGQLWQPGWMRTVNAPGPDYAPIAMQTFTTDVVVATKLYKPKVLTAETPLDGSATLDIVYL